MNDHFKHIKKITNLKKTPFRHIILIVCLAILFFLVWFNHVSNNKLPIAAEKIQAILTYDFVANPQERVQQFYNGIQERKSLNSNLILNFKLYDTILNKFNFKVFSNNEEDGVTLYLIDYFRINSGA